MRLDKFLKVSQILKRRTVANQLVKNQRVMVNGRNVKPSYEVKEGDQLVIIFGNRQLKARVLSTIVPKGKSGDLMYEIVEGNDEEAQANK